MRVAKTSDNEIDWFDEGGNLIAETSSSGGDTRQYMWFNGRMIARFEISTGKPFFYFADALRSTRAVTDANGNVQTNIAYFPFGQEKSITSSVFYKFTNKKRDPETQNDSAHLRMYEPQLARWLSVDPVPSSASAEDPQSLNRYAYVQNQTLNAIDSSGGFMYVPGPLPLMPMPVLNWPTFNPGPPRGGGGGRPRPIFANPSKSGPQQQTITHRLSQLPAALPCDPECSSFLGHAGVDPISTLKQIIDNGVYGHGVISMGGNPYSTAATSGGVPGMAIVVNNQGAFFNRATPDGRAFGVGPLGYAGGSAKAQALILLHELGHTTGVLRPDAGIPNNVQLNDRDIQSHCSTTLNAIK